jgi:RNA polymerase sigma-70 factor (ECF subfamily)
MSSITDDLRPLDEQAFGARVEPHRRELHVHCYRLLGSFEEAEDLVQEAFLRAWRRRETYEAARRFARGCTGSRRTPASTRSTSARGGRARAARSRGCSPIPTSSSSSCPTGARARRT